MSKDILATIDPFEVRVAVVENGVLTSVQVERGVPLAGNVYKGRVASVLPGMEAAFVDIGLERNAFLPLADVRSQRIGGEELEDPIGRGPIAERLRVGQEILVQVTKEPRGSKGARATTYIALPGHYIELMPTVTGGDGWFGLLLALAVAQVGSLFSADAWNNIGFTAAEVKNPKRDVALSMVFGTVIVITLYCLANFAYLCALPLAQIQNAADDRVATAALSAIFGAKGALIMAMAIIISTFGCNNGLILAGSRVAYAMAKDGLFFKATGELNDKGVPGTALVYQGIWIVVLILMRTRNSNGTYGNVYSNLLDYVVFAALLFYVLTIAGIFVLRWKRPNADRAYKAFGYPLLPLLYIVAASGIMGVILLYKTSTAGGGMVIVLLGVPVYWLWSRQKRAPG